MVEEKVVTEDPTIQKEGSEAEAEAKVEAKVEDPTTDIDALITELEKAGVTNTEQLQGKLTASREAGNLSNQLGNARQEIAELKMLISNPRQTGNEFSENEQSPDLESIIGKVLDKHDQKKAKVQAEIQKTVNDMWSEIQNDEDYHLVKDIWEEKLKDSNFIFQIQQGQANPVKSYNNVVRTYYKGIAKRSVDTIKTLQGGTKNGALHVEEAGTQTVSIPGVTTLENKTVLKELREKLDKGQLLTEADEMKALEATLKG